MNEDRLSICSSYLFYHLTEYLNEQRQDKRERESSYAALHKKDLNQLSFTLS